jgi:Methyltransferase domain
MMISKVRAVIGGLIHRARAFCALRRVRRTQATPESVGNWSRSLIEPAAYYEDCVRVFHGSDFPSQLKAHRAYFQAGSRGFGEDAFHVMWWMLFQKFRPSRFVEIGVYRGQTLSLASLLQRMLGIDGRVTGISPFSPAGDTCSTYRDHIDYLEDTRRNFTHFRLPEPELISAYSTDASARERVASDVWDAAYIDGNHDYEVAKTDWELCAAHTRTGGIVVLDDAARQTTYQPPAFATAGHPGPSRVAAEIDTSMFREILRVGHNRVFQKIA